MNRTITPAKRLQGEVILPRDKSILHRALMISAIAQGQSEIDCIPEAADPRSTMSCLQQLGVQMDVNGSYLNIKGVSLSGFTPPTVPLDAGNSGTTIRLLSGLLAGQNFRSEILGDESLSKRPMKRIIDPLTLMGAEIKASDGFTAPLRIAGKYPLKPIDYEMPVPSAQVKSAILLAGLFTDGRTTVVESIQTRDHTERMLNLRTEISGESKVISISREDAPMGRKFEIPGDFSAAAFFISAGLNVPNSEVLIRNVGLNPTRSALLNILSSAGANINIINSRVISGETIADICVQSSTLQGKINVSSTDVAVVIDELPILAVTAACHPCSLKIRGAGELRHKESDRIRTIVINLRTIGIDVEEYEDGFAFESNGIINGGDIDSHYDHRIAMAFAIGGMVSLSETQIRHSECVNISFPNFWETLNNLQK